MRERIHSLHQLTAANAGMRLSRLDVLGAAGVLLGVSLLALAVFPLVFVEPIDDAAWFNALEARGLPAVAFVWGPVATALAAGPMLAAQGRGWRSLAGLVPTGLALGGWLDRANAEGLGVLRGGYIGALGLLAAAAVAYWALASTADEHEPAGSRFARRLAPLVLIAGGIAAVPLGMRHGEQAAVGAIMGGFVVGVLVLAGVALAAGWRRLAGARRS